MGEGTFVGLDVHARSVVAGLIDEATGEVVVRRRRIAPTSWPNSWHAPCVRASSARCGLPDPADEAARDLVRAREGARADLMRARHRLSKLLLRHGLVYEPGRLPEERMKGLEPSTFCMASRRSSQLSYIRGSGQSSDHDGGVQAG